MVNQSQVAAMSAVMRRCDRLLAAAAGAQKGAASLDRDRAALERESCGGQGQGSSFDFFFLPQKDDAEQSLCHTSASEG